MEWIAPIVGAIAVVVAGRMLARRQAAKAEASSSSATRAGEGAA
jgi:hypothetical protein